MREFLVGLAVLVMFGVLGLLGFLLIPVLFLMGMFLRLLVGFFLCLLIIWLVGKVTLGLFAYLKDSPQEGSK